MKSTQEEIADLLQQHFDIEKADFDPDTHFCEYGLDSLTQIELVFQIEDHFKVKISELGADIQSVAALAALVDQLRQDSPVLATSSSSNKHYEVVSAAT